MLKFFRIYGLSCVVTLLIFYLSITTSVPEYYHGPRFEGQDKVVHFFLYMLLSLVICRDFFRQEVAFSSRKMIVWAIILPILYGGLIEILQENFFPPRTGEWGDWGADILGVMAGYFLSKWWYKTSPSTHLHSRIGKEQILIIGPAHPYRGGLAAFNERLAREFQKEGHNVVIYTFTLQYPSFLFPGKTQYSDGLNPKELEIKEAINSINPFNWIAVGRKIRSEKPDMVIFSYWMSFMAPCFGTIARIVKKDRDIKCIGLIHNMIPHEPNIMDRIFPSYFVNAMDSFVALSESVVGDIAKYDRKNRPKSFSPHPIYDHYGEIINRESALSKLTLDKEKRYLLFFGFIRAYKGLDLLLEAFADERLRKYNLKLIIAGEFYEDEKPYMEKIKNLGIEKDVELRTFFIPDTEVNACFCAADMVVQPYKTATQSGVTQIAYYFNKPMLVTNVGGLAEIAPDGKVGYVVPPNAKSIADALADFYENSREQFFVENVKIEKGKYLWGRMTGSLLALK